MWIETNTQEQLIKGIMKYGPEILENCLCSDDLVRYKNKIQKEHLDYIIPPKSICVTNWFIPQKYKDMDIEEFLIIQCPKENSDRLIQELELYRKHDLINVLRAMKYIVDTLRANKIVWGVGRGSSVASYVLFLLGVHKIDSVKYDLPLDEFFKEIKNG